MQNFKNRQNNPIFFFRALQDEMKQKSINTFFPGRLILFVKNTQSRGKGWKISIAIFKIEKTAHIFSAGQDEIEQMSLKISQENSFAFKKC